MKIKFFATLLLFSLLGMQHSTWAKKKTQSSKKTATEAKSLLWEVSGNGLEAPSYLFGTIHMICNTDYVNFPKLDSVYKRSNTVAVELDVTQSDIQMKLAQGLMATDGKKISDYFTEEEYSKIEQSVANKIPGLSIKMFESFHPAMLVTILAQGSFECDATRSYDMEIIQQAKADNKTLIDLEDVSVQINAIKSMPIDEVIKAIKDMTNDKLSADANKEMEQLVEAYKTENLEALTLLMKQSNFMKGKATDDLLINRNVAWISKIKEMMHKEPSLVTFGAAHLTGPKGVIQLLKDEGYTVLPIMK